MSKRQLEDRLDRERDEKLAKILGITIDELSQTEYEIDSNESKDGVVYDYFVVFSEESPIEILNKINGLNQNRTVSLGPYGLE